MAINGRTESGSRRTWGGTASLKRGAAYCRVIRTVIRDGREYYLHATKGWKSRTLSKTQGNGV